MFISVVSVINNRTIYENMLLKSLKMQIGIDYEIIEIDNCNKQFDSLTTAWNYSVKKGRGEYFLFCHPDVCFVTENSLKEIVEKCIKINTKNTSFLIFGGAGVKESGQGYMTFVHGESKIGGNDKNMIYEEVQTIDACCFLIKKEAFDIEMFSDYLTGFHMCIEDYCLKLKKYGYKVAVIPMNIWHLSTGTSLDYTYYRETSKVIKYNKGLKVLNTTSFSWKINKILFFKLKFFEIRNILHHKLINRLVKN